MLLGHPIDLMAKAGGEKSMSEKRGSLEGAEVVVSQDPRDKAKAKLLELQSRLGVGERPSEERLKPMSHSALA